jgi:predicted nuclease with RNAse H fold
MTLYSIREFRRDIERQTSISAVFDDAHTAYLAGNVVLMLSLETHDEKKNQTGGETHVTEKN